LFMPSSIGYDRAITVFSPEGRLYQVEYANEAVRHGTLAIGVKYKTGAIMVVEKRVSSPLMDIDSLKKIYIIDDHVGASIAGLPADARKLIDQARIKCQINRLTYDEPISIRSLVIDICDTKQLHTQYGGVRPFGVSLLIIGIDSDGPQLYTTDPSGSFWGWKATAIGSDSDAIREYFEDNYKPDFTQAEAIKLAIDALKKVKGDAFKNLKVEIAVIDESDKVFKILNKTETEQYL